MTRVAVYGTLRKDCPRNSSITKDTDNKYLGTFDSEPIFSMYTDKNNNFPRLINEGNTSVVFEVYEVNEKTLKILDDIEGFNKKNINSSLYIRATIDTPFGKAVTYICNHSTKNLVLMKRGDWIDYIISNNALN